MCMYMWGGMGGVGGGAREGTHSVARSVNDAFDASTNGLQSICANARGALREAFDTLAGFGWEVLGRLTAGG